MKKIGWILVSVLAGMFVAGSLRAEALVPVGDKPVNVRYSPDNAAVSQQEVPDFQKHISPLFGRLGCNGRACHGSFQGQGGFRLSLFGYDLQEDYKSLASGDQPRIDRETPESSLVLMKPMMLCRHKGGRLISEGTWEHELLLRWLEAGAKPAVNPPLKLEKLEVQPPSIRFSNKEDRVPLKVLAHWKGGAVEDVTPLCRFTSRDTSVARVDKDGLVSIADPGDTHIVVAYDSGVAPVHVLLPYRQSEPSDYIAISTPTEIDRLVLEKQRELGIVPSGVCSDAEFLRRVSLDLTGTLPAPAEVEAFLADSSENKRSNKIDELLERPAYAAWWATRFSDMTGNNAARMLERQATKQFSQQWYDWIRVRVEKNVPYDQIVKGIMLGTSRDPGESYEAYQMRMATYNRKENPADYSSRETLPQYWARLSLRTPDDKAMAVAHNFLGLKIQCAQCHKHPFDTWTQQEFKQFSAFFQSVQSVGTQPDATEIYRDQRAKYRGNQKLENETIKNGELFPWQEVYVAARAGGIGKKKAEKINPAIVKPDEKKPETEKAEAAKPAEAKPEGDKPADANPSDGKPVDPKVAARMKKRMEQAKKRQEAKKNQAQAKPVIPTATLPGGEPVELKPGEDPRAIIVNWMLDRKNPLLARALVNRIWGSHLGVGIVEPIDDLALGNPPGNRPLLDYLTEQFIAHDYDLKWLHREILNSRTYQLSWQTNDTNKHDAKNFSHALPRRMPAEVAYDAVQQAMKSTKNLDGIEEDLKARSILSTNGQNGAGRGGYALMVFGRPQKATNCDCERSGDPSLLQTIYLQNDQELLTALQQSGWMQELQRELAGGATEDEAAVALRDEMKQLNQKLTRFRKQEAQARKKNEEQTAAELQEKQKDVQKQISELQKKLNRQKATAKVPPAKVEADRQVALIREAYLRTLSRPPSEDEVQRCRTHLADGDDFVGNMRDMLWALINTKEFIVNH